MTNKRFLSATILPFVLFLLFHSTRCNADAVVWLYEDSGNVEISVTGFLDLNFPSVAGPGTGSSAFSALETNSSRSRMFSETAFSDNYFSNGNSALFTQFGTAPITFITQPGFDPGFWFGYSDVSTGSDFIYVPDNYVPGSQLNLSATIDNATLTGLGFSDGAIWGVRYPHNLGGFESITFRVGSAGIPEPSSFVLLSVIGSIICLIGRRKQK